MVKHKLAYNWLSHKGQDFLIWKQEKRLLCNYCFHQNLSNPRSFRNNYFPTDLLSIR